MYSCVVTIIILHAPESIWVDKTTLWSGNWEVDIKAQQVIHNSVNWRMLTEMSGILLHEKKVLRPPYGF